jgi:hypothetical protein
MSTYTATIRWNRAGEGDFAKGQYSRALPSPSLRGAEGDAAIQSSVRPSG